jgi:superfamily II DNA/RNA helicase
MNKPQNNKKKEKGTRMTWDQLSKLADKKKETEIASSWEEEADNLENVEKVVDEPMAAAPAPSTIIETDFDSYKVPAGLTWEEKQEYLMSIDEEEGKKSEYYCDSFDAMGLDERILRGIYSYGFDKPSRVQSRAIKVITTKKNCIVQAQSGTGKTGTFVISTLQNIDFTKENVQAIILSPTRELADQSFKVFTAISQYCKIKVGLCVGQMRVDDNINKYQIIVCTTGRLVDCIERNMIDVSNVTMLVMDEADEMLSQGFKEQVMEIHNKIPKDNLQVCLLSATLAPEIMSVAVELAPEAMRVLIKQEFVTLKGISQFFVNCIREEYKLDTLLDIFKRYMCTQSIVYVNSKNKCCWLASELIRKNHTVLYVDSSMTQRERSRIMREFRQGTCRILITTNLLSRGIDVQGVNLVINYDLPSTNNIESYVHRIGRCGRFGRKGVAINFITPNDFYIIQNIRKYYSTDISELPEDISGAMTY